MHYVPFPQRHIWTAIDDLVGLDTLSGLHNHAPWPTAACDHGMSEANPWWVYARRFIITSLIKGDVFNWGQIMSGALLGAAPPLVIYAFLMDYYIAGLTAGATKG